jgi:phosphate starvation-inducible protein PhoH and related proteins
MGRKLAAARQKRGVRSPDLYLVESDMQLDMTRQKKTWNARDCKNVVPLTDRQHEAFQSWYQRPDSSLALVGSAGTGKTLTACYLGINEVLNPKTEQKQLIIIRSAVETRQQGFLPGTLEEKEQVYKLPYIDLFEFLFGRTSTFADMCAAGLVKFMTTSHVRGLTFDNAVIILDEFQSTTFHEVNSVMTRVGKDSRIILCGDGGQNDLHAKRGTEVSGFDSAVHILKNMDAFDVVKFTKDDIVRSEFVKQWIIAAEQLHHSG